MKSGAKTGNGRRGLPPSWALGLRLAATGGFVGWLGPTALLSYRNWMLETGVQFPIATDPNGEQERPDYRTILALEYVDFSSQSASMRDRSRTFMNNPG